MFIGGSITTGGESDLGTMTIQSTAQSISTSTGSLQVYGGVGVGKNLYAGGNLYGTSVYVYNLTNNAQYISETCDSSGNGSISSTGTNMTINNVVNIQNTVNSTSTSTGSLIVGGGGGFNGTIYGNLLNQSTISWEDQYMIISPNTGGNFATLTQINTSGLYYYVFPHGGGNDKILSGSGQLPHSSLYGSSYYIWPHVHLYADTSDSNSASFTFSYQFINAGATSSISLTSSTVSLQSPITANTHYMLELTTSGINLNGITGSSVILFTLSRSHTDAYTGNLFLISIDYHYPMQRLGDSTITP